MIFFKTQYKSKYLKYIFNIPFIDLVLIKWYPGCITKIHNHSKNGCNMILFKGKLREEIFNKNLSLIDNKKYNAFNLSYIDDKKGYHRILNDSCYNSYSLHIYHPKNHNTKYFN